MIRNDSEKPTDSKHNDEHVQAKAMGPHAARSSESTNANDLFIENIQLLN